MRGPLRIRKAVYALLPPALQEAWRVHSARRSIDRFPVHEETHSFIGFELPVLIADPVGAAWYGHDWPPLVLPELELLGGRSLQPGARVFEIGAHQGIVAMVLAQLVGADGLVVAAEPNSHNAAVASRNIVRNRLRQVVLLNVAVGASDGNVRFAELGSEVSAGRHNGTLPVPTVTVDQLTDTYGPPNLLYVDVEGFEYEVLQGAKATLESRPDVAVEVHDPSVLAAHGTSCDRVLALLPEDDYELFVNHGPNDRVHGVERLDRHGPLPDARCTIVAAARWRGGTPDGDLQARVEALRPSVAESSTP